MLRASRVSVPACPHPRDERRGELASGDEADDKSAKAEALMHMEGKHWHCEADYQERDENHPMIGSSAANEVCAVVRVSMARQVTG
jgi:hypothetical protein